jgi:ABC-2 type transport system permease protein
MSATTLTDPPAARVSQSPARSDRRRALRLALWQVLYEQRTFWRNKGAAFFSFALPVMFVVVFGSINKSQFVHVAGRRIPEDLISVPGVLAYGVIMATFGGLAVTTAVLRDSGALKRLRGTPLPGWAFVAGRIGSAVLVVAVMTAVTLAVGDLAYGVHVRLATLPGLILALILGTACFSALGLAALRIIPNADSAVAITNGLVLPLTFVSDVWGVFPGMPGALRTIGDVFPIRHLAHAVQAPFDPRIHGAAISGGDLLVLGAWLALGVLLATSVWRRETRRA